jgi:hypothetical protein
MSVRRLAAMVLVPLLAAPPVTSKATAATQPPSAGGLQVDVDPTAACILAGQYPVFQGAIVPPEGVTRSRLFFRSSLSPELYYVEALQEERGRYVARLPRPRLNAGPIIFYLEATGSDFAPGRSAEGNAIVVRKIEQCPQDRKGVPVAPGGGPVSVFDVAGNPAFPAGFEGVAGGVAAASAGVGAAAGSGAGFITSTAGLITLGAVAVGITAIVIATDEPNSPSR